MGDKLKEGKTFLLRYICCNMLSAIIANCYLLSNTWEEGGHTELVKEWNNFSYSKLNCQKSVISAQVLL